MKADVIPLIVGAIVFLSSLISLKLGLSVAIAEIVLGAAGSLGLKPEEWTTYMAGFGGIILTFLAGTEIDTPLMREKFKATFLIGIFFFYCRSWGFPLHLSRGGLEVQGRAYRRNSFIDNFARRRLLSSGRDRAVRN